MKRYFNTKEKANAHLKYRRDCAYKRIKERGDYVLGDASFTYRDHRKKWVAFLQIITKNMMNDLEAAKGFEPESKALIPFTEQEIKEIKLRAVEELKTHYMKTLEVDDYTTIKE